MEKANVVTVFDLRIIEDIEKFAQKGVTQNKLHALKDLALKAKQGAPLENLVMDHTKNKNPYKSLYGNNRKTKISRSQSLNKYACITSLVRHIYDKSAKLMKGEKHKNDWVFYHDALSLMTANQTITWMKQEGIYSRCLLPLEINRDTSFFGRPVGNSLEMMLLDATLNKDVDDGVCFHIALTTLLDEDDPKKLQCLLQKEAQVYIY